MVCVEVSVGLTSQCAKYMELTIAGSVAFL